MLFSKILPVHIALGNSAIRIDGQSSISDLDWQPIFQIKKANLTDIFQLTTCLANLAFLESCIAAGPPSKNCEWSRTNLAFLVIICFCLYSTHKCTRITFLQLNTSSHETEKGLHHSFFKEIN